MVLNRPPFLPNNRWYLSRTASFFFNLKRKPHSFTVMDYYYDWYYDWYYDCYYDYCYD